MFIKTKMTLNTKHTLLILSLCVGFAACSETDESWTSTGEGKTPITLSVGGVDAPASRAVITDGQNKTMQTFDIGTKIFFVMRSEMRNPAAPDGYEDYGYKGAHKNIENLYTVCRGEVGPDETTTIDEQTVNTVNFPSPNQHYWDDAHARSSILSIWAYAQKGQPTWNQCSFQEIKDGEKAKIDDSYKKDYNTTTYWDWQSKEIYPAIREWNVFLTDNPDKQTKKTVECQDLLFSNNITYNEEKSWPDNRLKFDFVNKQFPRNAATLMKFYHAMSKITIKIKAGEGFKADGTDFVLGNSKSTDLLDGFNTKGLFNIKDGEFQMIHARTPITSIPNIHDFTVAEKYYTLEALVVPNIHQFYKTHDQIDGGSRFDRDASNVMIQFTVDGNTYRIKSGALYDALKDLEEGPLTDQITKYSDNGDYIPMEAGKNYVFTFTIDKEKIKNISASLADWIPVTAVEQTPSNAYITVEEREGAKITGAPTFDLYRAPGVLYTGAATETAYNAYADYTWEKGYEKSTGLNEASTGIYSTEWYWPNNQTFYHFRTISPQGETIQGNDATTYISMTGGTLVEVDEVPPSAKDYIWGAPFKRPAADNYSNTSGYCNNANKADGQLYKAIGSTKDNITLTQHHMTSQVFVDLESVTGTAAVDLTSATVELINIAQEAKLNLGNGLVTDYSNFGNQQMTPDVHAAAAPTPAYDYSYGVLPQLLNNTNGAVGLKITTNDGNVYIINDIRVAKDSSTNDAVTEWLPGRKYYYRFRLSKTAIDSIKATIVDWKPIEATYEDVKIQ